MSLNNALSNAMSGLRVTSRLTDMVADNLANSLTPGYSRRNAAVTAISNSGGGGGVRIHSINRAVSLRALDNRQSAAARMSGDRVRADFLGEIERIVGLPGAEAGLGTALSKFRSSLVDATASPNSRVHLDKAVGAAQSLTHKLRDVATAVQDGRTDADRAVEKSIATLNANLESIAELNETIITQLAQKGDANALMDQRQALVDKISEIVPVRVTPRDHGRIAVFTRGGATLLDGEKPAVLGFAHSGRLNPAMTSGSPMVSEMTLDGEPMTDRRAKFFAGGTLSASFEIRDELGPDLQRQLDALAAQVASIFQDPAVDPTVAVGGEGLFTDAGATFSAANEVGLSLRLKINDSVNSETGGESWRLRAGVNASSAGDGGDTTLLQSLVATLDKVTASVSPNMTTPEANVAALLSDFAADLGQAAIASDISFAMSRSYYTEMDSAVLTYGVDSDAELQRLMQLEVAYGANARVIQAATHMLDTILEIR